MGRQVGRDLDAVCGVIEKDSTYGSMLDPFPKQRIQVRVTHAKIFGWYDDEYGIYTNLFGELAVHVHRMMN